MSSKRIAGTFIVSLIACFLFIFIFLFFSQNGVLETHLIRDVVTNAAEQATIETLKTEELRKQEAATKAQAEAEANRLRRKLIEKEN